MHQLHYLLNSHQPAQAIQKCLLELGLDLKQIKFVSHIEAQVSTHQLHATAFIEQVDIVRKCFLGALFGLIATAICIAGLWLSGLISLNILSIVIIGVLLSLVTAWLAGMVAFNQENHTLINYQQALLPGQLLLIINTPPCYRSAAKMCMQRYAPYIIFDNQKLLPPWRRLHLIKY